MMPATKSHAVMIELIDTIGQPALQAIATAVGGDLSNSVDNVIGVAGEMLSRKVTPETADRLVRMMLESVSAEGLVYFSKDSVFDEHFAGRMLHMYKVVAWSIGVNYSDFFEGARSNRTVQNVLEVGGQALKVLTATLQSGLSAAEKAESTSETLSH